MVGNETKQSHNAALVPYGPLNERCPLLTHLKKTYLWDSHRFTMLASRAVCIRARRAVPAAALLTLSRQHMQLSTAAAAAHVQVQPQQPPPPPLYHCHSSPSTVNQCQHESRRIFVGTAGGAAAKAPAVPAMQRSFYHTNRGEGMAGPAAVPLG